MSVIRVEKNKNFTCMSNVHLRDNRLTLKAKGLLSLILSLPDDWTYSVAGLTSIVPEGERAIEHALKELKVNGYVSINKKTPAQTDSGRYEYEYIIREIPDQKQDPQNSTLETTPLKQHVRKQGVENNTLETWPYINNVKPNTDVQITDIQITDINKHSKADKPADTQSVLDTIKNAELIDALNEFIKYRKEIKHPVTPHALKLLIDRLGKLATTDKDKIEILNQSMVNGWQGVFALDRKQQSNPRTEHYDKMDKSFMNGEIV